MDDWDADDFDPTAQLADKIATYGLEERLKAPAEPAPKKEHKSGAAKKSASAQRTDLSRAEIEELQQRADMELFADLIGVEPTDKKFTELESRLEFKEFAEKAAAAFTVRAQDKFYTDFVTTMVDEITKPLNKFQVENIVTLLQVKVKQLAEVEKAEKEAAEAEKAARQPKQQQQKKKIKKEVFDDYVVDEYDDYADKF